MARENKMYYWIKLKKNFFERHDIKIIENTCDENDNNIGRDAVYFYFKLLTESTSHLGNLRYSDNKAYTADMLASVFNMPVLIVKTSMELLSQYELLEVLSDGTLFMKEASEMLGEQSEWAKQKKEYRDKKKNDFNNFQENDYNFGEIEKKLSRNGEQK